MPRGKKLGRDVPDLFAPAAVAFSMAGRCRSRDGWKPVRSVRAQSLMIIRDDTCEFVGRVNTVVFLLYSVFRVR